MYANASLDLEAFLATATNVMVWIIAPIMVDASQITLASVVTAGKANNAMYSDAIYVEIAVVTDIAAVLINALAMKAGKAYIATNRAA